MIFYELDLELAKEQAKLIKSFFDKISLKNKLYCYRRYETEDDFDKEVRMHCFVLFFYQDSWYHFEHANYNKRGIHKYFSLEEAINTLVDRHDKSDIRELTEISNIPDGLSFKEFNKYVNQFDSKRLIRLIRLKIIDVRSRI